MNLGWEEILVLMLAFAGVTGQLAHRKGCRTAGWAFLGFWLGPLALVFVALLPSKSTAQTISA